MPHAFDETLAYADTLTGYDRWAPSYDLEPNALVSATGWVLDRAPLGCADADVLELGCGTGRNARRAISEGARSYVGLDGSQGMLSIAAQRIADPRVTFGCVDLLGPFQLPQQFDLALIVLVLEHLVALEPMLVSLARALRPGARARIIDLHPERIATGTASQFREGATNFHFTSVAHEVASLCDAFGAVGFDTIRRDWLATDTMVTEVPGLTQHRGTKLLLDFKLTRRGRERRGSGSL
jgi:SAM-dependent methyltransferase